MINAKLDDILDKLSPARAGGPGGAMTDDINALMKASLAGVRKQAAVEAEAKGREDAKFDALLETQKAVLECLGRIEALLAQLVVQGREPRP